MSAPVTAAGMRRSATILLCLLPVCCLCAVGCAAWLAYLPDAEHGWVAAQRAIASGLLFLAVIWAFVSAFLGFILLDGARAEERFAQAMREERP